MSARRLLTFAVSVVFVSLAISTTASGQPSERWYAGDLHCHSTHSDGDSPVEDVIASAVDAGLEFLALTDHDTSMNGSPSHWYDPAYCSDRLILLYGIEWTSDKGHANIWASQPFDYSAIWPANRERDPDTAIAEAHDQGALFSINHPAAILSRYWGYYPVPEGVDSVEVWNNMYRLPDLNRWAGHGFWDALTLIGRRLPGVGGSDTHHLVGYQSFLFGHGNPTTWVFAHEPTAQAILDGIKDGRVSISYAPDFGRLDLSADVDEDGVFETMMGDTIEETGESVTFRVQLVVGDGSTAVPPSFGFELSPRTVRALREGKYLSRVLLRFYVSFLGGDSDDLKRAQLAGVFKNGSLHRVWFLYGENKAFDFRDVPNSGDFYRVELMGEPAVDTPLQKLLYGYMLAMTNPIYVSF